MGSLLEELARREAAARDRVEAIREQIDQLRERLAAEEQVLSRLMITLETIGEVLSETTPPTEQPRACSDADDVNGAQTVVPGSGSGASPIGMITVPRWRVGMDTSVLPRAYRDILDVLADAGGALRAGQIVAAVGLPAGAAKVEGMRSKLKRMVERGWLREQAPGLFSVTEQVHAQITR